MKLTNDERDILNGIKGETLQKTMESVVSFGDAMGATELVDITGSAHFVMSPGVSLIKPYYKMIDELLESGLSMSRSFTVDPRPVDRNIGYGPIEGLLFHYLYGKQSSYEKQLNQLGLKDQDSYSCSHYLPELGNSPERGAVLAWSESSAVVYVNSVLGARTNRNSAGLDMLCNVIGKAPLYGLLTDDGRKADFHIKLETTYQPDAQLLGGVIGNLVQDKVPYITGLDQYLGKVIDDPVRAYLKDMGASSAANGAVGLFHVENLTPEAKGQEKALLRPDHKVITIVDHMLSEVYDHYPVLWKTKAKAPQLCIIGCPHLSYHQLESWITALIEALDINKLKKAAVKTILCAAPKVINEWESQGGSSKNLKKRRIIITPVCPLMHLSNPISEGKRVITNSNKLRTYTPARFYPHKLVIEAIVTGKLPEGGLR